MEATYIQVDNNTKVIIYGNYPNTTQGIMEEILQYSPISPTIFVNIPFQVGL